MAFDLEARFHETWLGMVQPVEGLVVSIPVLVEAQTMERHGPALQETLIARCPKVDAASGVPLADDATGRTRAQRDELARQQRAAPRRYRDLAELLADVLGWTPDLYDRGDALSPNLARYIAEGHQTLRPTLALKRLGDPAAPPPAPRPAAAPRGDDAPALDDDDDAPDDAPDDSPDEDADAPDRDDGGDGAPRATGRALTAMPDIETPESLAGKPYLALVWELPPGLDLDRPETVTGDWRYPPAAKFDRLLRACRVPIGLLTNHEVIRLVYAPHGEASGSITFDLTDMGDVGGRPILDAFVMLLSARRCFAVAEADTLPALLKRSRERQANVTNALAAQVFDALDVLLRGFEAAASRDRHADLGALVRAADDADDHFYGGLLTVLLRLVFILYAEDRALLPTEHETYAKSLSLGQLFEDLQRDHGAFPDTMSRRFGAWSRLLALFRVIHDGAEHGALQIPRRRGELFDPGRFPFLESWAPAGSAPATDLSALGVPTVDDETVYRVLERLLLLDGQRLSYKVLTVEQIGSVYEALMGYGVARLGSGAVCCRHKSLQAGSIGGVWIEAAAVLEEAAGNRGKALIARYDVVKGDATKVAADLKAAKDEPAVLAALERIAVRRVARRGAGSLVLQPGEERRRTSSHYTPRSLSEPIVKRTLEPLIVAMSEKGEPSSAQLLSLKVCDPAMGSGAFLVAACRYLADHVVAAWEREGATDKIASAREDVVNHARRLVAQTCLYGVDRNPFAVSLAKLSLWLETLAKDEPFTFVDHALRWGDSLVGLSFAQLQAFHWAPTKQVEFIEPWLTACVGEALGLREEILRMAGDASPGVQRLKEQLLWDANDAQERLRVVGDLVVGAFFECGKKEREGERRRRMDAVQAWLEEGGELPAELAEARARVKAKIPVFHWGLEFPEVFHRGRKDPLGGGGGAGEGGGEGGGGDGEALMDAFVGNPPFAGKNGITAAGGPEYLDWLKTVHEGAHGNADLSAHFFRRADSLLGKHGTIGLIATNTIAQGDTRASALQPMLAKGYVIYDATRSMLWPGEAAVAVSVVHMAKGMPAVKAGAKYLDGEPVADVNSRLGGKPERPDPVSLAANAGVSFIGSYVLGMGFTLDADGRRVLVERDRRNAERIFEYLGGREVNSHPCQSFERYVICFADMELDEALRWPDLIAIVRDKVKPERDRLRDNPDGRRRKQYWWQFGRWTPALYSLLAGRSTCLVTARTSKHVMFSRQPTHRIFSENLVVFLFDSGSAFSALQSRVHAAWVALTSSTLESRQGYRPSDCFETFPLPPTEALVAGGPLDQAGRALYDARAAFMQSTNQGLTTTYNLLKDPDVDDPAIVALRALHLELDRAVLAAYGWADIPVPAYTDPVTDADWKAREAFEDELIDRLFALNATRATAERLLGPTPSTKSKPKPPPSPRSPSPPPPKPPPNSPSLFPRIRLLP
jgi:hypothetical protein